MSKLKLNELKDLIEPASDKIKPDATDGLDAPSHTSETVSGKKKGASEVLCSST